MVSLLLRPWRVALLHPVPLFLRAGGRGRQLSGDSVAGGAALWSQVGSGCCFLAQVPASFDHPSVVLSPPSTDSRTQESLPARVQSPPGTAPGGPGLLAAVYVRQDGLSLSWGLLPQEPPLSLQTQIVVLPYEVNLGTQSSSTRESPWMAVTMPCDREADG